MSDIKLGSHTIQERDTYLTKKIAFYLKRHPKVSKKLARKYARVKWARKVNSELLAKQHPNPIKGVEKL